jgi:hypothetical protein
MKKITNADRIRWQMLWATEQVLTVLDWDMQEYADLQYEAGIRFLKYYHAGDDYVVQQLSESRHFWGWWRVNWHARDTDFLDCPERKGWNRRFSEIVYQQQNDVRMLADARTEWGKVLEESWCRDFKKMV